MWWFILGVTLLIGTTITISVIIDKVKDYIKKKYGIKYKGQSIKAYIEKKAYNEVYVGILDTSGRKIDKLKIEGDGISDDVKKGQIIEIQL